MGVKGELGVKDEIYRGKVIYLHWNEPLALEKGELCFSECDGFIVFPSVMGVKGEMDWESYQTTLFIFC